MRILTGCTRFFALGICCKLDHFGLLVQAVDLPLTVGVDQRMVLEVNHILIVSTGDALDFRDWHRFDARLRWTAAVEIRLWTLRIVHIGSSACVWSTHDEDVYIQPNMLVDFQQFRRRNREANCNRLERSLHDRCGEIWGPLGCKMGKPVLDFSIPVLLVETAPLAVMSAGLPPSFPAQKLDSHAIKAYDFVPTTFVCQISFDVVGVLADPYYGMREFCTPFDRWHSFVRARLHQSTRSRHYAFIELRMIKDRESQVLVPFSEWYLVEPYCWDRIDRCEPIEGSWLQVMERYSLIDDGSMNCTTNFLPIEEVFYG